MPKSAARIFLEVTDIRVEQLQDITEEDARAEGADGSICEHGVMDDYCNNCPDKCFAKTWNKLYAKKPEMQWDKNPFVFVISFKRLEDYRI
jgi:hypothetical protein